MNLHRLVKWADQLLQHCRPGAARAGSALAKLRSALDQLPTCKAFIGLFRRDAETLLQCQEVLKVKGLSEQTREQCHQIVEAMPLPPQCVGALRLGWRSILPLPASWLRHGGPADQLGPD